MNLLLLGIFFHFNFHRISGNFLNEDKIKISLELIKQFEIRQCILVGDTKSERLVSNVKEFSSVNLPVTHFDYNSLLRYVASTEKVYYFSTGVILSEINLAILELVSNALESVSQFNISAGYH